MNRPASESPFSCQNCEHAAPSGNNTLHCVRKTPSLHDRTGRITTTASMPEVHPDFCCARHSGLERQRMHRLFQSFARVLLEHGIGRPR